MKLKDVYITWKVTEPNKTRGRTEVKVVPKSKGIPKDAENFFDPDLWDQSDLSRLFALWFATLTIGFWEIPPAKSPSQVYEELTIIDEFDELLEEEDLLLNKRKGSVGKGDRDYFKAAAA